MLVIIRIMNMIEMTRMWNLYQSKILYIRIMMMKFPKNYSDKKIQKKKIPTQIPL